MRLSMKDYRVDYDEFEKVIDTFTANGFNHFDTALSYEGGKSETDLRDCLTSRYPQDAQLKLFFHRQSRWLSFYNRSAPLFYGAGRICYAPGSVHRLRYTVRAAGCKIHQKEKRMPYECRETPRTM